MKCPKCNESTLVYQQVSTEHVEHTLQENGIVYEYKSKDVENEVLDRCLYCYRCETVYNAKFKPGPLAQTQVVEGSVRPREIGTYGTKPLEFKDQTKITLSVWADKEALAPLASRPDDPRSLEDRLVEDVSEAILHLPHVRSVGEAPTLDPHVEQEAIYWAVTNEIHNLKKLRANSLENPNNLTNPSDEKIQLHLKVLERWRDELAPETPDVQCQHPHVEWYTVDVNTDNAPPHVSFKLQGQCEDCGIFFEAEADAQAKSKRVRRPS